MKTTETLTELLEFVTTQAMEDAVLPAEERAYQAGLVADVLGQEPIEHDQVRELIDTYSEGVASHLVA